MTSAAPPTSCATTQCGRLIPRTATLMLGCSRSRGRPRLASSRRWDPRAAACVVAAAAGYPGNYERGKVIRGLDRLRDWRDGVVFHAGTARRNGVVVTNGGRVLGVTALGADIAAAVGEAYRALDQIGWEGMQYRRDIGRRAMERKP